MSNDINADLPDLLRQVREAGFKVNNLFHRVDGMSQANLRAVNVPLTFAFAYGPCFSDALRNALEKAKKGIVAPLSTFGDDARDPRQIGGTKEVTRMIHPGELLPGQEGTVEVDPAFVEPAPPAKAKKGSTKPVAPEDEWSTEQEVAAAAGALEPDDDDLIGAPKAAAYADIDDLL